MFRVRGQLLPLTLRLIQPQPLLPLRIKWCVTIHRQLQVFFPGQGLRTRGLIPIMRLV